MTNGYYILSFLVEIIPDNLESEMSFFQLEFVEAHLIVTDKLESFLLISQLNSKFIHLKII